MSGVHYCEFQEGTEETITKDELNDWIDEYALMLPLIVKGENFVKQFTLVYSDWTVLRSDNQEKNKGIPWIDIQMLVWGIIWGTGCAKRSNFLN